MTLALTDDDGTLRATTTLDQLRRLARRSCPDHPDGTCGCSVLDRPAEVDCHDPSPAQQAFIHTRDRTCRFPTCGQRRPHGHHPVGGHPHHPATRHATAAGDRGPTSGGRTG